MFSKAYPISYVAFAVKSSLTPVRKKLCGLEATLLTPGSVPCGGGLGLGMWRGTADPSPSDSVPSVSHSMEVAQAET